MRSSIAAALSVLFLMVSSAVAQFRFDDLPTLLPGRTAAKNALWLENPLSKRFLSTKRVVVAEIRGPATITMIHFAKPNGFPESDPKGVLNRDVVLKIYWDGEREPSVDCPLVDFFCDPAGLKDEVNTALVNKRRGWNAYFPMPFRKSARVELVYDGPLAPGNELLGQMPCYSYVMYRTQEKIPDTTAYFHGALAPRGGDLGQATIHRVEREGKGQVCRLEPHRAAAWRGRLPGR